MIKEKIKQTVFYVTSDGKEFRDKNNAEFHEEEISMPERVIPHRGLELELAECYTICYNIQSEEDFHYLGVKEWKYNYFGSFQGPGWYIAFRHDGGDYADDYDIIKAEEYLAQLENDVNEIKDLTNS